VAREPGAKDIIIELCYESPTASNKEIIKMHAILRKYSNVATVILGDFNHGDINWTTGEVGLKGREFLDLVDECFLIQWVKGNKKLRDQVIDFRGKGGMRE